MYLPFNQHRDLRAELGIFLRLIQVLGPDPVGHGLRHRWPGRLSLLANLKPQPAETFSLVSQEGGPAFCAFRGNVGEPEELVPRPIRADPLPSDRGGCLEEGEKRGSFVNGRVHGVGSRSSCRCGIGCLTTWAISGRRSRSAASPGWAALQVQCLSFRILGAHVDRPCAANTAASSRGWRAKTACSEAISMGSTPRRAAISRCFAGGITLSPVQST